MSAGVAATPALAIDLSESVDLAASPADAWAAIADFCSIATWHPVIASCEQSEDGDKTMRTLTTGDGGVLLEELHERWTRTAMSFSYCDRREPAADCRLTTATISDHGKWRRRHHHLVAARFDSNGVSDQEALELMTGIYRTGLDELASQLGQ